MLCSFASTSQSKPSLYEYWPVFKQASHLTCWQMIAGDEPGELCSHSWQPLSLLKRTLSTRSDQTSRTVSVARPDPRRSNPVEVNASLDRSACFSFPTVWGLQVILNPNYWTFTVVRMIAWMNPQHGLPGLKGYFDGSGMFDERDLCRSALWY